MRHMPLVQERGGVNLLSPRAGVLFSPRVVCGLFSPTYKLPGL